VHYYKYLHSDWVIESQEPRPDLLEWAYWSEIDAPASKPAHKPVPEHTPEAVDETTPVDEPKPARKPRTPRTPKPSESE
jgi:hypothetical protein